MAALCQALAYYPQAGASLITELLLYGQVNKMLVSTRAMLADMQCCAPLPR